MPGKRVQVKGFQTTKEVEPPGWGMPRGSGGPCTGRAGAVPRCATGPTVKPIVGRTPPAPGEREEEGEPGTNLLHLLWSS